MMKCPATSSHSMSMAGPGLVIVNDFGRLTLLRGKQEGCVPSLSSSCVQTSLSLSLSLSLSRSLSVCLFPPLPLCLYLFPPTPWCCKLHNCTQHLVLSSYYREQWGNGPWT